MIPKASLAAYVGTVVAPVGTIAVWTTGSPPTGWVLCDGASLLRAGTYADLFAVIGTTFGSADGTHFNVPNLKGLSPMGVDSGGSGEIPTALAQTKGESTHTLTSGEMPVHSHAMGYGDNGAGGSPQWNSITQQASNNINTANAGSGNAHNVVHPVLGVHFIIKY